MDAETRALLVVRDAEMEVTGEPFSSLTHALRTYFAAAIRAAEEEARRPLVEALRDAFENGDHAEGCVWFDTYPPLPASSPEWRCDCWKGGARAALGEKP